MTSLPVIALTMGDPAGIGPWLCLRAARKFADRARIVVYGAQPLLAELHAKIMPEFEIEIKATGHLSSRDFVAGEDQAVCGKSALDTLDAAVQDALAGTVDAIVTAPMSKRAVNMAGVAFQGHTERIAEACGVEKFAMMQSAEDLRVGFVTTHIPLRDVSENLSIRRVVDVIQMSADAARADGITNPRVAVAALNPHAGEGGFLGNEEIEIIAPAIETAVACGIRAEGPCVPDVLFIPAVRKQYDAIVSMYHDQGHIPFKMLAFDRGVNSTLGLPIIRTSPDHGTAYDLVRNGATPDTGSFDAAVETAIRRSIFRRSGT